VRRRSDQPFADELAALLAERRISQRKLAQLIDVNPSHLSRVISGSDGAHPSAALITRIADALGLPSDYFLEQREAFVVSKLHTNPKLVNELYDRLAAK
jgi:transcriptional regulator with XRE-family HTH domain